MEIIPYNDMYKEPFTEMFTTYFLDDLKVGEEDPRVTPAVIREKISPHILSCVDSGAVRLDLLLTGGKPTGFSIYQVDSPESDWNRRPGWGFIREFWIARSNRRQGLGRALAAHTELCLREMGAENIYLTTDEGAAFWAACGYINTGGRESNGNLIFEKRV